MATKKTAPADATSAELETSTEQPTHIVVQAIDERGFRRAGRYWSPEATTVAIDEFSPEQIERLLAEPELTVAFIVVEPA